MNVLTVVTAHTSRLEQAEQLCADLDATMFLDDGTLGEPGNTRAALRWAQTQKASHVLILQDDALPVPGFLDLAHAAIAERPDDIISYYLGTGRPAQTLFKAETRHAERTGAHWITTNRLYWGVAWSTPTALLPRLNTWLAAHTGPTDRDIGEWMKRQHPHCAYTWPSLVDHADGPTLIHRNRAPLERKAWKVRTPASHSG